MIYVIVVGMDVVHHYGPFENHADAHRWVGDGSAFAGRKVFVQTLDPREVTPLPSKRRQI